MGVCIGIVQTVHFRAHTVTPLQWLEDICQHVAVDLVHIVRFRETDALRKVNVLSSLRSLRVAFSDGRI